jgi:hypothetical protein
MRRRTKSYDKSYVGSSDSELKSDNLRKGGPVTDLDVEDALRARFLTADLAAPKHAAAVADAEYERLVGMARDIAAGRITVTEARAQLRGAA